jgi:hypothetical protein
MVREVAGKELHEIRAECVPLVDRVIRPITSSEEDEVLFRGAEAMPEVAANRCNTRAEHFDQRHQLDPEDNDAVLILQCSACSTRSQGKASLRQMKEGFETECPTCGTKQRIDLQAVTIINVDPDSG